MERQVLPQATATGRRLGRRRCRSRTRRGEHGDYRPTQCGSRAGGRERLVRDGLQGRGGRWRAVAGEAACAQRRRELAAAHAADRRPARRVEVGACAARTDLRLAGSWRALVFTE